MARSEDWKPEDRFLYLIGEVTDEVTDGIVRRILENWHREFLLVINSDGGSCYGALAMVNLMRAHGRVDTLCIGIAESGAADVLAAGRKRYIVPGSIAMLHQVSWELGRELASNVLRSAEALQRLNTLMAEQLAASTGRSREELDRDMMNDFYLYDRQIIEYGLADEHWDPAALLPPMPRRLKSRMRGEAVERRPAQAKERDDERDEPRAER